VSLINIDISLGEPGDFRVISDRNLIVSIHLFSHIIPVLSTMDAGFERRRPSRSVYTRSSVFRTLDRLPVYKKGDGILSFRYAVVRVTRCDTRCGTRDHSGWHSKVLEDPAADVDVMRRKVVTLYHKQIFPR